MFLKMSSSLALYCGLQASSIVKYFKASSPFICYSGEYNIIRLKGNKKIDKEPEKLEDNIHNIREFGDFILDIPLKTEEYVLKNEKTNIVGKKGLIIIEFKLDKKIEYSEQDDKEEEEV
jgi:hypothetical protein